MDGIHTTLTSLIVLALVFLIVFVVCHFLKPRAVAWIRSNGEEKISLSKNKLYHANGYMIQSNSDILLGSTGSFKRFDSVDRDYKQVGQSSIAATIPTWNIPVTETNIPPQPLRPAPTVVQPQLFPTGRLQKSNHNRNSNNTPSDDCFKTIKQQSLDRSTSSTAIPRPVTKRQLSTPISSTSIPINLSANIFNITKLPRLCTNPFLNGSLESSPTIDEDQCSSTNNNVNVSEMIIRQSSTTSSSSNPDNNSCNPNNPFLNETTVSQPPQSKKTTPASTTTVDLILNVVGGIAGDQSLIRMPPPPSSSSPSYQHRTKNNKLKGKIEKQNKNIVDEEEDEDCSSIINSNSSSSIINSSNVDDVNRFSFQNKKENEHDKHSHTTTIHDVLHHDEDDDVVVVDVNVNGRNKLKNYTALKIGNDETKEQPFMNNKQHLSSSSSSLSTVVPATVESSSPIEDDEDVFSFKSSSRVTFYNILSNLSSDTNDYHLKHQSRARSLSETEFFENSTSNPFVVCSTSATAATSNKPKLHKTLSENFLEQYNLGKIGRTREGSIRSLGSICSIESAAGAIDDGKVQRAISCESVTSQSSIVVADLETVVPEISGYLCIGMQYDKNSYTESGQELIVTVLEAKELIGPSECDVINTFVRIYIVPDETGAMQTKIFKNSTNPSYNESFSFWIERNKATRRSLWFHLYHTDNQAHTLIGEAEMKLNDLSRPITTWLALSDSKHNKQINGELMFSLSYLPTAERLTVVVAKARNLKFDSCLSKNIFVKVYLLKNNKKVSKKKTTIKKNEKCPNYNESMIFSVPPYMLNSIQIRLTVVSTNVIAGGDVNVTKNCSGLPIGHVIVGSETSGKGLRHWHQMLSSLRKPVAMWHPLRLTNKQVL